MVLDPNGWADVNDLLEWCNRHGVPINKERLVEVVTTNEKQRFAFNADQTRIRANQGHSIDVDLGITPKSPPARLHSPTLQPAPPYFAGSKCTDFPETFARAWRLHSKPAVVDSFPRYL